METDKLEKNPEKNPNYGGRREGSGRKPSLDLLAQKETKRRIDELWVEMCEKNAIPYYLNVMTNVEGTPEIKAKVASDILNRALGKPKERHEVSGPDGEPIKTDVHSPEVDKLRSQYEEELRKLSLQ